MKREIPKTQGATTIYVPRRVAQWLKLEAARRGMSISRYLETIAAVPPDFQSDPDARSLGAGRPRGPYGEARRYIRELVLVVLRGLGGEGQTEQVLDEVHARAAKHLAGSWLTPHGAYRSRIRMAAAFERKTLSNEGLVQSEVRGRWCLSEEGRSLASRIARVGGPKPA